MLNAKNEIEKENFRLPIWLSIQWNSKNYKGLDENASFFKRLGLQVHTNKANDG